MSQTIDNASTHRSASWQRKRDPLAYGRVAVLMGGTSAERDISLLSGKAVLAALCRQGVDAHSVDVTSSQSIDADAYDHAVVMLHGRMGEDGTVQGHLEMSGIKYSGSGVLGSALGMDKIRTKLVWLGAGLPTPAAVVARTSDDVKRVADELGFPVIVKPCHEGSSIGMAKAQDDDQLQKAWKVAAGFDGDVLIERWVTGSEYTVGILENDALPVIRLETPNTFYDYEAKYVASTTRYLCPCGLSLDEENSLQSLALQAFNEVGASGWGRVDLMLDENGQAELIEVNTVPGMTDHSLVPMAAKAAGIDFDTLAYRILETAS